MELVRIFVSASDSDSVEGLYAVRYVGHPDDCLFEIFEQWNDAQWMLQFCIANKPDLEMAFGRPISPNEAAMELMDEAKKLEKQILSSAIRYETGANLDSIFKPLRNLVHEIKVLQASKTSYSYRNYKPKLRIYASRIDPLTYIVTGGAIKLTKTMDERTHTLNERVKVEACCNWLRGLDIREAEDLREHL